MTILSTIAHFCVRTGLPEPSSVMGASDPELKQIRALLEEGGNALAKRASWQALTFEASWTTVATESQGAMTTIAPNGFRKIKNETIWDRTDRLPVCGPLDSKEWQRMKAMVSTGPRYRYRIVGGNLLVNPVPAAGHDWRFEYVTKNWILAVDGVTYRQYFSADTDTILLPEDLLLMDLRWRWKKEKGFDYAEEKQDFELQLKDDFGADGSKKTLSMNNTYGVRPGILVPEGNWALP